MRRSVVVVASIGGAIRLVSRLLVSSEHVSRCLALGYEQLGHPVHKLVKGGGKRLLVHRKTRPVSSSSIKEGAGLGEGLDRSMYDDMCWRGIAARSSSAGSMNLAGDMVFRGGWYGRSRCGEDLLLL